MSSYRERLCGNWFYHYQRAETARVRDKRVEKICLHLLFLYTVIPPTIPSSFFLTVFFSFIFWSASPFQTLNHQTTILLSTILGTKAVSLIIHLYFLICDSNALIFIYILKCSCLSLRRPIEQMELSSFTTVKSVY